MFRQQESSSLNYQPFLVVKRAKLSDDCYWLKIILGLEKAKSQEKSHFQHHMVKKNEIVKFDRPRITILAFAYVLAFCIQKI